MRDNKYKNNKDRTVSEPNYALRRNGLHYTSEAGGIIKPYNGVQLYWKDVRRNLKLQRVKNDITGECHSFLGGIKVHSVFLFLKGKIHKVWDSNLNDDREDESIREAMSKDFLRIMAESENLPRFEIWTEGYMSTGNSGQAYLIGWCNGKNFRDAVERFVKYSAPDTHIKYFDLKKLTYWGCRLYDNEHDARKAFG